VEHGSSGQSSKDLSSSTIMARVVLDIKRRGDSLLLLQFNLQANVIRGMAKNAVDLLREDSRL
jgi:hypothetical protein